MPLIDARGEMRMSNNLLVRLLALPGIMVGVTLAVM